jgi:hypothetical protein
MLVCDACNSTKRGRAQRAMRSRNRSKVRKASTAMCIRARSGTALGWPTARQLNWIASATPRIAEGPPAVGGWRRALLTVPRRSRALYYRARRSGRGGNWVDGNAGTRTDRDLLDQIHHLAKVRVAGSNPVFRSIVAGQGVFFNATRARVMEPLFD